jgi:hypothetical protein
MILSEEDSLFLKYMRSIAIFTVVFGHAGGFRSFEPYSKFLLVVNSIFFFISGAVLYYSYQRSKTIYSYYKKRIISILIPYYLLCLLCLITALLNQNEFSLISLKQIILFLLVRPSYEITPFPINHLWFLVVFLNIIIVSPFYFSIYNKNKLILLIIMCVFFFFSFLETIYDIEKYFYLLTFNFYRSIFYSMFFISGFYCFLNINKITRKLLLTMAISSIVLSVIAVHSLNLNISYNYHSFPPDMYFFFGSVFPIAVLLAFRSKVIIIVKSNALLDKYLIFLYRHTFSFFLLHTFAVYIVEKVLYLGLSPENKISYGIIRLFLVLTLTSFLAPVFSKLSLSIKNKSTVFLFR